MRESIGQCIVNGLSCRKGSHVLFRNYGMDATDQVGRLRRGQVVSLLKAYYPDVSDIDMSQKNDVYTLSLKGEYRETE